MKCADCGGVVSHSARACPHCGSTRFSYSRKILVWGAVAGFAYFAYAMFSHPQETTTLIGNVEFAVLRAFVEHWSSSESATSTPDVGSSHDLIKITCNGTIANNDVTQKDESIRQGTFIVDSQDTGTKTERTWYHILIDGEGFWIAQQSCVSFLAHRVH
jgi:hypothetical protein